MPKALESSGLLGLPPLIPKTMNGIILKSRWISFCTFSYKLGIYINIWSWWRQKSAMLPQTSGKEACPKWVRPVRQNSVVTQWHSGEVYTDGVTIRKPALISTGLQTKLAHKISRFACLPSPTGYTDADPTLGSSLERTQSMSSPVTTNTENAASRKVSLWWCCRRIMTPIERNTNLNA